MGLETVIGEVRHDGETRAQAILAEAEREAQAIITAAKEQAQAMEKARLQAASRDAEQLAAQAKSRAESEARKAVLAMESELRAELQKRVLKSFADIPAKTRQAHIQRLLATAQKIIPAGKVWGAASDSAFLAAAKPYQHAGDLPIVGGIVVESEDGTTRVDLSYETLLDGMWRDVLASEAALF